MSLRRTRTALAALVLSLLAAAAPAASLARLADAFVAELSRSAGDAPVELSVPDDPTRTGVALDLHALVQARLRARPSRAGAEVVRAESVVAFEGSRLVLSARLTRGGELVDVVSVSVDRSESGLALARQPTAATGTGVDVLGSELSPPLGTDVVALAFLDAGRLAVLAPAELRLYRREGGQLQLEAQAPLPATVAARRPGGRLQVAGDVVVAWTSLCPEGRRFRAAAGALRDTGVPPLAPLRFAPGTNVLEGDGAVGPGRFLAADGAAAVDADGVMRTADARGPRTGGTLAVPWPDVAFTSAAAADELQVSWLDATVEVDGRIPVPGDVRALAAWREGSRATLAAAVQAGGHLQLLLMDVGRPVLEGEAAP